MLNRKQTPLLRFASLSLGMASATVASHAQAAVHNELRPSMSAVATNTATVASSSAYAALPEAPQAPQQQTPEQAATTHPPEPGQTKRILGIIPNFQSVSAETRLPPLSVRQKFVTATKNNLDYTAFVRAAASAGISQGLDSTPEFGQGARGFGRYYWHKYADRSIQNYAVQFVVPALRQEDSRYYTLGKGGFVARSKYALRHTFITRSDRGGETFNGGEIVGNALAAGLSTLYYPAREKNAGDAAEKWGLNIGVDAGSFLLKEFWPDINRKLTRSKAD